MTAADDTLPLIDEELDVLSERVPRACQQGLQFAIGGAQTVPLPAASVDPVLMLKSLHPVPLPLPAQALGEVARVLGPEGHLCASEPVHGGRCAR